jgi:hypothetical protein
MNIIGVFVVQALDCKRKLMAYASEPRAVATEYGKIKDSENSERPGRLRLPVLMLNACA